MGQFVKSFKMLDLTADIAISGAIDEHFQFEPVPETIRTISVQLEQIEYISSFGVKLWVNWIASLPRDATLILKMAKPMTIANINAVEGFILPKTIVESVIVPFTTDDGEEIVDVILENGSHYSAGGKLNLPTITAASGEAMVPDFIPERLFKFLKA